MKCECQACGFLGLPGEVLGRPDGVAIVCAQCGVENLIAAAEGGAEQEQAKGENPEGLSQPVQVTVEVEVPDASGTARGPEQILSDGLIVSPGAGPMRCPKCGFRQAQAASCVRCGLSSPGLEESIQAWRGDVPSGKQPQADAMDAAWGELLDAGLASDQERCNAFINMAHGYGLLDRASRLIRLYAQEQVGTTEGASALRMLGVVIQRSHAAFLISEGSGGRDAMVERTQLIMKGLYLLVAAGSILALIAICWVWLSS